MVDLCCSLFSFFLFSLQYVFPVHTATIPIFSVLSRNLTACIALECSKYIRPVDLFHHFHKYWYRDEHVIHDKSTRANETKSWDWCFSHWVAGSCLDYHAELKVEKIQGNRNELITLTRPCITQCLKSRLLLDFYVSQLMYFCVSHWFKFSECRTKRLLVRQNKIINTISNIFLIIYHIQIILC